MRLIRKTRVGPPKRGAEDTKCLFYLVKCSNCAAAFTRKYLRVNDPTIDKDKDLFCPFCGAARKRCYNYALIDRDCCYKHNPAHSKGYVSPYKRSLRALEQVTEVDVLEETDIQSSKGTIELLAQKAYKLLEECEAKSIQDKSVNFDVRVNIIERVARVLKMYEDLELRRHKETFEFDGEYKAMLKSEISRIQREYFSLGMIKILDLLDNSKTKEVRKKIILQLNARYQGYVKTVIDNRKARMQKEGLRTSTALIP